MELFVGPLSVSPLRRFSLATHVLTAWVKSHVSSGSAPTEATSSSLGRRKIIRTPRRTSRTFRSELGHSRSEVLGLEDAASKQQGPGQLSWYILVCAENNRETCHVFGPPLHTLITENALITCQGSFCPVPLRVWEIPCFPGQIVRSLLPAARRTGFPCFFPCSPKKARAYLSSKTTCMAMSELAVLHMDRFLW